MGFATVLWLDERPLRAAIGAGTDEAELALDLGTAVLRVANGSYAPAGLASTTTAGGATIGRAGTFHSTDARLLRWTGEQLETAPLHDLEDLAEVDRAVPAGVFVDALGAGQQAARAREVMRHPHTYPRVMAELAEQPLTDAGAVSFWWVRHDAISRATDPMQVGQGMLSLLRTHLGDGAAVGSHANAVGKLGTLTDPATEFAFAWWGTAAYRLVRLLDSGEEWTKRFTAVLDRRRA